MPSLSPCPSAPAPHRAVSGRAQGRGGPDGGGLGRDDQDHGDRGRGPGYLSALLSATLSAIQWAILWASQTASQSATGRAGRKSLWLSHILLDRRMMPLTALSVLRRSHIHRVS
ncbi:hypothetical protein SEUCBS139899_006554 [Sporothrix eucalyptigena]|uniref:Uncharacterized protein n=1 Tax=Sporothrix eucalyptigena TaxID=1812306 RepID=A0ABP0B7K4_9PEZI